jgi:hypothetical protein
LDRFKKSYFIDDKRTRLFVGRVAVGLEGLIWIDCDAVVSGAYAWNSAFIFLFEEKVLNSG